MSSSRNVKTRRRGRQGIEPTTLCKLEWTVQRQYQNQVKEFFTGEDKLECQKQTVNYKESIKIICIECNTLCT